MNKLIKNIILLISIFLLVTPTIATLNVPTTYHRGFLIYGDYIDFHGEVGVRNGSMENVSIENATNVNTSNLNVSSKLYVNTSGAIFRGTYNASPILHDYLDSRLLNDSNSSILLKQKVDDCTGSSQAVGWNGTGFPCKTISSGVVNSSILFAPLNVTQPSDFNIFGGTGGTTTNGSKPVLYSINSMDASVYSNMTNGTWSILYRQNASTYETYFYILHPGESLTQVDAYIQISTGPSTFKFFPRSDLAGGVNIGWAYGMLNDGNWHWINITKTVESNWKVYVDSTEVANSTNTKPENNPTAITHFVIQNNGIGAPDTSYVVFQNQTNNLNKQIGTIYRSKPNATTIVTITAEFITTSAGGNAYINATVGNNPPFNNIYPIGIQAGLLNEEVIEQMTIYVPGDTNYFFNVTTSNGIVRLKDMQEVSIP